MKPVLLQNQKEVIEVHRVQKVLLTCGIISSLWYLATNIIVPLQDQHYNVASQTVSELSAIDAPTRTLWVLLCIFYSLLLIAFGLGIWLISEHNKKLWFVALIIIFDAILGFFWPPMHLREVIAAGGETITDTLHIVWTIIHLVFVLLMIIISSSALGKGFRIYSIATILVFIVFGILTSKESPGIETGEPTPYIGIWERINIAASMLWIIVFATALLLRKIDERK